MDAMIGETAPDRNQDCGCQDRANQWHTCQEWLSSEVEVENSYDQKNGEQAENDSAYKAIRCTPTSQQLTNNANEGCNENPDE